MCSSNILYVSVLPIKKPVFTVTSAPPQNSEHIQYVCLDIPTQMSYGDLNLKEDYRFCAFLVL